MDDDCFPYVDQSQSFDIGVGDRMAAMGQSRRFDDVRATSALPLIADVRREDQQVRKVPEAETFPSSEEVWALTKGTSSPPAIQQGNHIIGGVFTQSGSKTEVCPLARHVRSTLRSRHRQATRSGPVRAVSDILHRSIQHIIRSSCRRWHRGPSSRPNRRDIVRFGDQHYLGGHRSWT
jgi:hypothetical protein